MWIEVGMIVFCVVVSYGYILKELWSSKFNGAEKTHPTLPNE
jgi:hypothetical protein